MPSRTLAWFSLLVLSLRPGSAAAQSAPWWPATGSVLLAGGGLEQETADLFVDRLIALAGGPDAIIVLIPTAWDNLPPRLPASGPEPANVRDLRKHFMSRGARHVIILHTRDRQVANSDSFVSVLKTANAVFFTGGRSRVLDETYHGTLVERELKALLLRGGVLAGDSAGAITLGCSWLNWASRTAAFGVVSQGLCVLPGVTVTPHVRPTGGRVAEDEMTDSVRAWVTAHPGTIAINIQENTVLVLQGSRAQVLGKGGVTVFDRTKSGSGPALRLRSGEQRDLAE